MVGLGREKCELAGSLLKVGSDYSGKSVTTIAAGASSQIPLCPDCGGKAINETKKSLGGQDC
jgi:hypothetical protein